MSTANQNNVGSCLRAAGCDWYQAVLDEEGMLDQGFWRERFKSECECHGKENCKPSLVQELVNIGLDDKHAVAVVDELERCGILRSKPEQESELPKEAEAAAETSEFMTTGGIYSRDFLEQVAPLYDQHMGAENLAGFLYSLVRFVKPKIILEVGAGYTSIFLLQAVKDNETELKMYQRVRAQDRCYVQPENVPWSVDDYFERKVDKQAGVHCIDNLCHAATTAHKIENVARTLGMSNLFHLHEADAFNQDLPSVLLSGEQIDFLWIDLGAGHRIDAFFEAWFPRVCPDGGIIAVHSTLTNAITRNWLEKLRAYCRNSMEDKAEYERMKSIFGRLETLSILEPMKLFQNSISIFKKFGGPFAEYTEPLLTNYP
mmetsp:Transcript_9056/g.14726  ORF Transcript_9056/g.14726 Transcript_9056/m.14726 type:complete len:373 (-) Transcript_9056:912-2030(-)